MRVKHSRSAMVTVNKNILINFPFDSFFLLPGQFIESFPFIYIWSY